MDLIGGGIKIVHIRMNDKMKRRLKIEAINKGLTLNSLILQKLMPENKV